MQEHLTDSCSETIFALSVLCSLDTFWHFVNETAHFHQRKREGTTKHQENSCMEESRVMHESPNVISHQKTVGWHTLIKSNWNLFTTFSGWSFPLHVCVVWIETIHPQMVPWSFWHCFSDAKTEWQNELVVRPMKFYFFTHWSSGKAGSACSPVFKLEIFVFTKLKWSKSGEHKNQLS